MTTYRRFLQLFVREFTGDDIDAVITCVSDCKNAHEGNMYSLVRILLPKDQNPLCGFCSTYSENPKRCSRCHKQSYCNAVCQRNDWRKHSRACACADEESKIEDRRYLIKRKSFLSDDTDEYHVVSDVDGWINANELGVPLEWYSYIRKDKIVGDCNIKIAGQEFFEMCKNNYNDIPASLFKILRKNTSAMLRIFSKLSNDNCDKDDYFVIGEFYQRDRNIDKALQWYKLASVTGHGTATVTYTHLHGDIKPLDALKMLMNVSSYDALVDAVLEVYFYTCDSILETYIALTGGVYTSEVVNELIAQCLKERDVFIFQRKRKLLSVKRDCDICYAEDVTCIPLECVHYYCTECYPKVKNKCPSCRF